MRELVQEIDGREGQIAAQRGRGGGQPPSLGPKGLNGKEDQLDRPSLARPPSRA